MKKVAIFVVLATAATGLLTFLATTQQNFEFLEAFRESVSQKVIISADDEGLPVLSRVAFYSGCLALLFFAVSLFANFCPSCLPGLKKFQGDDYIVDASVKGGWAEIQEKFVTKIRKTTSPKEKKVEIFGFTFIGFWPTFRDRILNDADIRGWTFDVYFISPELIKKNPDLFEKHWLSEAETQLSSMTAWFADESNTNKLKQREVKITLRSHEVLPFVHGKYWGDETAFIHIAHWSNSESGITYPNTFHEIFPGDDQSKRAAFHRTLLRNWATKYEKTWDKEIAKI